MRRLASMALAMAAALGWTARAAGAESPAAPGADAFFVVDFDTATPGNPWTATLTHKDKEFKQPKGFVAGVKGWRAHVGGERATLAFTLGVEAGAGRTGRAGDHAGFMTVEPTKLEKFFYARSAWSVPPLRVPPAGADGRPDRAALSLTADVKATAGARYTLTLMLKKGQSFVFEGTGTGEWQAVGGPLDKANRQPSADADLVFDHQELAVEFTPQAQGTWNPKGTALIDNIRVGPLSGAARARPAAPAPIADNRSPFLRVQGNKVLDDAGREYWLQGLNIPSMEWSPGENILKTLEEVIVNWKVNIVRLPVSRERWMGEAADQQDGGAKYVALVDQVVARCAQAGIHMILDLHRYRMPGEDDLAFWRDAAARYANNPTVLFGLLNEPHGISWDVWKDGGTITDKPKDAQGPEDAEKRARRWRAVGFQELLDAVRATGANNVCVVGALDWAYDLSGILKGYALTDKAGRGIIYDSHIYPWKSGWNKAAGDVAAVHPVLLGEVGADPKGPNIGRNDKVDHLAWCKDMLGYIQAKKLHWTGWCFHPRATPRMIEDWDYTPTPSWGVPAKAALAGEKFPPGKVW